MEAILAGAILPGFFGGGFAAANLLRRIHGAAAFGRAAVADGFVVAAVVEAVVVCDFFGGGDVADGLDPDVAVFLFGFAVGVATVIDEHGHGVAVDDDLAVAQSKEVGDGRVLEACWSACSLVSWWPVYSATRAPFRMAAVV